jgi:phospholipase/lecithinase/hemolysin
MFADRCSACEIGWRREWVFRGYAMPKVFFLGLLTLLGLTQSRAVPAQELPPIRRVVSFGDSLSDAGTYWFRFTTNPGLTFAQHLALHYGQMPFPNQHLDRYEEAFQGQHGNSGPGGLNYAEGGAKADSPYSTLSQDPEGKPISARQQLNHFLKQHHQFEADQLVTLFVGTNDVAYNYDPNIAPALAKGLRENRAPSVEQMNAETRRVEAAADATAAIARDILKEGAKRLVVFNLFDLGQFPWFQTSAAQTYVTALVKVFNRRLLAGVPQDSAHVLILDTEAFVNNLIANASRYGFKHGVHEDACGSPDHDYCYPETQATPDADETYLFAAGEHLTTHTHQLLADYVIEEVSLSPLK